MNKYNPKNWDPFYFPVVQFKSGKISAFELVVAMILSAGLFLGFFWNIDQKYAAEVIFLCVMMAMSGNFMDETSKDVKRKRIFFAILGLFFSFLILKRWWVGGEVIYLVSFVSGVLYFATRIFGERFKNRFSRKYKA